MNLGSRAIENLVEARVLVLYRISDQESIESDPIDIDTLPDPIDIASQNVNIWFPGSHREL